MYFKISLLFWVLYFFTATRCIGLGEDDLTTIVGFFEKYEGSKNESSKPLAMQYVLNTGYKKLHTIFPSKKTVIEHKAMPDFLIFLADIEKNCDAWEDKSLTTYEVKMFVNMFIKIDKKGVHDGLLTYDELVNLIDADLRLEPDVRDKIKNEFNDDDKINAPKFLATLLKHKPDGRGLDKTQMKTCSDWYKPHSRRLPTNRLRRLIRTLRMVSKRDVNLLTFVKPAALELQEFLVFWSEYNKEVSGDSPFLTSKDVRDFIYEFTEYDGNKDGFLDLHEFKPAAETYFEGQSLRDVFNNIVNSDIINTNNDDSWYHKLSCSLESKHSNGLMNTVMFLYMKYCLINKISLKYENKEGQLKPLK